MTVEGVLSLLLGVGGEHGEHGVDADHLVEVRAVHVERLPFLLLSLLERSGSLFGDAGAATPDTPAAHSCLRHLALACNGFLLALGVRLARLGLGLARGPTVASLLGLGIVTSVVAGKLIVLVVPAAAAVGVGVRAEQAEGRADRDVRPLRRDHRRH